MRILVVEDEPRIADSIKRGLEIQHYAVDVVYDSESAMAAAADSDYDLVILDRMLPGKYDGIDISREVRSKGVGTPILMLTARSSVDDRVEGLQSGADDYLTKPFSMKELTARVQVLFRRPSKTLDPEIKIEDLSLNPSNFKVSRSGKEIELSSKEYKLLAYLMYNQGQTVSKDKIITHVWDGDTIIVPNTVEVYIGYLRNKIDKAFPDKKPLVNTVRGFGYRLGD